MSISKFFKEAIAYRLGGGHQADHKAMNVPSLSTDSNGNVNGLLVPNGYAFPLVTNARHIGGLGDSQTNLGTIQSTFGSYVNIITAGSGYAIADGILLPNGILAQVGSISTGGVPTSVSICNAGQTPYTPPSGIVAQIATSGSGTNFTGTITKAVSGSQYRTWSQGLPHWIQLFGNGGYVLDPSLNYGISGCTSTQLLGIIPAIIPILKANNCGVVTVWVGTNDLTNAISIATTTSNLAKIYALLLGAGIRVIAIPIMPRATNVSGGDFNSSYPNGMKQLIAINIFIARYVRDNQGMYLADATMDYLDLTSTTGYPYPATYTGGGPAPQNSVTFDGLHPAPIGAYFHGLAISSILNNIFPASVDTRPKNSYDTYDSLYNPYGNLIGNPATQAGSGFFSGATIAATGAGASGVIPVSYPSQFTLARVAGTTGTIVGSIVNSTPNNNGLSYHQYQLVAASNTDTFSTFQLSMYEYNNIAIGDNVYAECEIFVSGATGIPYEVALILKDGVTLCEDGSGDYYANAGGSYLSMTTNPFSGFSRTPILKAAATNIQVMLQISFASASSGITVKIGRLALRKAQPGATV